LKNLLFLHKNKILPVFFLLGILLLLGLKFVFNSKQAFLNQFESELHHKELLAQKLFREAFIGKIFSDLKKEGSGVIVLKNDSLYFYDGLIPEVSVGKLTSFNGSFSFFDTNNHFWIGFEQSKKNQKAFVVSRLNYQFDQPLIKRSKGDFYPGFYPSIDSTYRSQFLVKDTKGSPLFYLNKPVERIPDLWQKLALATGFFFLASLFLVIYQWYFKQATKPSALKNLSLILAFLLILRLVLLYFTKEFKVLFPVFRPELYAKSFWLPSLGDLLLNALFLITAINILITFLRFNPSNALKKNIYQLIKLNAQQLLIFGFGLNINYLLISLLYDSNISFNVKNAYSLSIYSLLSVISLAILFFIFYRLNQFLVQQRLRKIGTNTQILRVLSPSIFIAFSTFLFLFSGEPILAIWPFLVLFSLIFLSSLKWIGSAELHAVIIFTLTTSIIISKSSQIKENEVRKLTAEDLVSVFDPELEILFSDYFDELENFTKTVGNSDLATIWAGLNSTGFSRLIENYQVQIKPLKDSTHFERLIRGANQATLNCDLWFNPNPKAKFNYLFVLPFNKPFYVSLHSKKLELKASAWGKSRQDYLHRETDYYSVGRFFNGRLVERYGAFDYSQDLSYFTSEVENGEFFNSEAYNHYFLSNRYGESLIISVSNSGALTLFSAFSYLILIFGFVFLTNELYQRFSKKNSFSGLLLREKIQILLLSILFLALVPFVLVTNFYLKNRYEAKAQNTLKSQLDLAQRFLVNEYDIDKARGQLSELLQAEPVLFNENGTVLSPSFSENNNIFPALKPYLMEVFSQPNKNFYIQKNELGENSVYSGYLKFTQPNLRQAIILNLTLKSLSTEVETEISSALISILNLFVGLLLLSGFVSFYLTEKITKPLKSVQDALSKIELGARNTQIKITGNNELTEFIAEYNRKVGELEQKAQQLARTERETAWREMAKQVAHEIKNPLTPMKLSIQHFERSFKPENDVQAERLARFTKSLIFQIDTLTNIANEFSSFAKMPKAINADFSLLELLSSAVNLFSRTDIEIKLISNLTNNAPVFADKEQMLRVFNNLIQNAAQAIDEGKRGKILCFIATAESFSHQKFATHRGEIINPNHYRNFYFIEVRDNGVGISEEKLDKIFVPYFTTKTKGTGLGLAIVKNIVESAGGKIWFESKLEKGTAFYILIPAKN
jgi:two-component system nitrogen regulation sensor histidine kinase NtrY